MPVCAIVPIVDGESAMDMNVEIAAGGVGLYEVRKAARMLTDFAEPTPQRLLFATRELSRKLQNLNVNEQPQAHRSRGASGESPNSRPNSSCVTQFSGR